MKLEIEGSQITKLSNENGQTFIVVKIPKEQYPTLIKVMMLAVSAIREVREISQQKEV